jgi:REP element-mobilizing transposase RayT
MARPLRIEFANATYHVTSRGDRREPIFCDDADRQRRLSILGCAASRFDVAVLAYCLMGNHDHFVLQTRQANLGRFMRHMNGLYTQAFNRRHATVGHIFQGRFKAILVDTDSYLLEVCRYVELNPVRAALVQSPGDWPWSSYRAHTGQALKPAWLDGSTLQAMLLGRTPEAADDVRRAFERHAALVAASRDAGLWASALRQQIYLGDDAFVQRMQRALPAGALERLRAQRETPRAQVAAPMTTLPRRMPPAQKGQTLLHAYRHGGVPMTQLAAQTGLSVSWVSRLIARAEAQSAQEAKGKT